MPRSATAAAGQAREPAISTESCFSALEGFAAARDLEDLARQHVRWNSSSTSSWMATLKVVGDAFTDSTDEQYCLLSAALLKPLGRALANALRLLAAEGPASLLSEVCIAPTITSHHVQQQQQQR
jgi:hypothetical protein